MPFASRSKTIFEMASHLERLHRASTRAGSDGAGSTQRRMLPFCPRFSLARRAELNDLNLKILKRVQRGGRVYISNATIHGSFALRACIVNHRTTQADVEAVVDEVVEVGHAVLSEA